MSLHYDARSEKHQIVLLICSRTTITGILLVLMIWILIREDFSQINQIKYLILN